MLISLAEKEEADGLFYIVKAGYARLGKKENVTWVAGKSGLKAGPSTGSSAQERDQLLNRDRRTGKTFFFESFTSFLAACPPCPPRVQKVSFCIATNSVMISAKRFLRAKRRGEDRVRPEFSLLSFPLLALNFADSSQVEMSDWALLKQMKAEQGVQ